MWRDELQLVACSLPSEVPCVSHHWQESYGENPDPQLFFFCLRWGGRTPASQMCPFLQPALWWILGHQSLPAVSGKEGPRPSASDEQWVFTLVFFKKPFVTESAILNRIHWPFSCPDDPHLKQWDCILSPSFVLLVSDPPISRDPTLMGGWGFCFCGELSALKTHPRGAYILKSETLSVVSLCTWEKYSCGTPEYSFCKCLFGEGF